MRTNDEIIEILKEEALKKELSISELARRVEMAKATVFMYFNKTREFPLNRVEKFSKVLGVSSEYLLGFDNEHSDITAIYNQLKPKRKIKVYKYAESELKEQKIIE